MFANSNGLDRSSGPNPLIPIDAVADDRPSLLIIAPALVGPTLEAMADGAGFRVAARITPDQMADRLARTVALDALCLDLRGSTGADDPVLDPPEAVVRSLLAWPGISDTRLLVLANEGDIDRLWAILPAGRAQLAASPAPADIALALCLAARRADQGQYLHDVGRETDSARLEQLSHEVRRLAQTIDQLMHSNGHDNDFPGFDVDADRNEARDEPIRGRPGSAVRRDEVRALLRARRLRDRYLPADLFADPAWDMMLDLMAARLSNTRVSVSSLCIAAAVPPTTALRWITTLTDRGIFSRTNDPADARRVFIALSDEAAESLASWFAAIRRAGTRFAGAGAE